MNKGELIEAVSEEVGLPKVKVNEIIDSITGSISATLASGGKVMLLNFGTFSVGKRSARMARNPKTNVKVKVKAKRVVKFKAGVLLEQQLAGKA